MQKSLGWIMLFAGMFLLFIGFVFPMVTVVLDNTPPVIGETAPSNGATYTSGTAIIVQCYDLESGIATVKGTIDGTTYDLAYTSPAVSPYEIWAKTIPAITSGTHTFSITVQNKAGLVTTKSGTFSIYTNLQGKWYVNDIEITDPSQTVYSTNLAVTFKFVKTAGVEDSKISCSVWEGSTQIAALTLVSSGTWQGTYTFTGGKHTLTIRASDGMANVIMSMLNLDLGEKLIELPTLNTMQILGLASTGIGAVLIFTGKTQAKKR